MDDTLRISLHFNRVGVADFDGKNGLDLLLFDSFGVTPLLSEPGGYRQLEDVSGGALATDVDGDGLTDVIGLDRDAISPHLATGEGTFSAAKRTPVPLGARLVATLDVDADHRPDVVLRFETGNLVVLRGNGEGAFSDSASFSTTGEWRWTLQGDFDRDEHDDLAVPSPNGGVLVLRGACTVSR